MGDAETAVEHSARIRVGLLESRRLFGEQLLDALRGSDGIEVTWHGDVPDAVPGDVDVLVADSRLRWEPNAGRLVDLAAVDSLDELARAVLAAPPALAREETPRLTPREREVLVRVAAGDSAADTAERLGISARTVERHKQALLVKLGVRSQAEAVARAAGLGLLGDG